MKIFLDLRDCQALLKEVNLGATAIGTGINTKAKYQRKVISNLREVTGVDYVTAGDLIEATQDTGAFVHISGILKRVAIKISKICNDLRLLSSVDLELDSMKSTFLKCNQDLLLCQEK